MVARRTHRFEMARRLTLLQLRPLFLHLLLLCTLAHSHAPAPAHLLKSTTPTFEKTSPTQYLDLSLPVPRAHQTPSCSLLLLQHNFSNTVGSPPISVPYSPPSGCPPPWSSVAVHLKVSCRGEQYDRIAAVWIDGVEILRTSTAEPTDAGVFWSVRKDVTRYASVLLGVKSTVSMMLENVVNDVYTGIYHVTLSLDFYVGSDIRVSSEEEVKSVEKMRTSEEGSAGLGFCGDGSGGMARKLGFFSEQNVVRAGKFGFVSEERDAGKGKLGFLPSKVDNGEEERYRIPESVGKVGSLSKKTADTVTDRHDGTKSVFLSEKSGKLHLPHEEVVLVENDQGEKLRLQQEEDAKMKQWKGSESLYKEPADLIIPISDNGDAGSWFRIQNDSDIHSKEVKIPVNTRRAVLEIYVSFHGDDEFWYSNPPDSYIQQNNLKTGRRNGAFRQVFVTIDGLYAGAVIPFPVVFTGGINPLFWEPVVAIGAFNLPSYDLDLTPFLGRLLDGKLHSFGIGVTDGIPFWLVDANLHLWLDHGSSHVEAKLVWYHVPNLSVSRQSQFLNLDGKFRIESERIVKFSGWVKSSAGNLTTHVLHDLKFKNKIKFKNNGTFKEVEQKLKATMDVKIEANPVLLLSRAVYYSKYPLRIKTSTLSMENNTYLATTNFSHAYEERSSVVSNGGISFTTLFNTQDSNGQMLVQDHSVLSGESSTEQSYSYHDDKGCYSQVVAAKDGQLLKDESTEVCFAPL